MEDVAVADENAVARPVARVAVDVPLPHLDRPFDYAVPAELDAEAQPGVRVRVRFAGRLVDGFVLERRDDSDAPGKLAPLERVVSAQPTLTAAQARLVRAVADHYAGTFADVVRLAVPPRHAATERAEPRPWPQPDTSRLAGPGALGVSGSGFLAALREGHAPRAWWQVPPVASPVGDADDGIVRAAAATLDSGRRVLVVVPDATDVDRLLARLEAAFGRGCVAVLHSDLGPSSRYRNYLACLRGTARIVVGTRAAAMAPVDDLGLVVLLDDGDDLHAEPRAPYPHTRTVAALRVPIDDCGLLVVSRACTAEVRAWVEHGWLHPLTLPRGDLRREAPLVKVAGDSDRALERDPLARQVRLPGLAFETLRNGLAQGPVLVQVPRGGHLVSLVCQDCRTPVRCVHCHGPVRARPGHVGTCTACGRPQPAFRCPECGSTRWRAPVVGASRTAEELGRAFPGTPVVDSSRDHVVATVGPEPRLVVATPGAEPDAVGGYAAGVLLDTTRLLTRADLRAGEEALRRWLAVVGRVRPGHAGGTVCVVGPPDDVTIQALVRLDPAGHAARELDQRRVAGLPPAVRWVTVDGTPEAVRDLLESAGLPQWPAVQVLGPVDLPAAGSPGAGGSGGVGGEVEGLVRASVRAPSEHGPQLVSRVRDALAVRSARKGPPVRVRVDPAQLG